MKRKKTDRKKLQYWQERLAADQNAYEGELSKMDRRETLYRGDGSIDPLVQSARKTSTPHVRNICAELIEAQVDSNLPQPKVTAVRPQDELKARLIEDMLRNEMDRLDFEKLNDMMARTVPIQGGAAFIVEWDNSKRTHYTVGELAVSVMHPKQVIPQDGVYTGIEDMDHIILKLPQTKESIRRRYGVDVSDESEQEPEIKGVYDDTSDDLVTQYVAYYRNDNGGIGLYSWVNNTEIEDLEDYQARRLRRCSKCGAAEPAEASPMDTPTFDGNIPGGYDEASVSKAIGMTVEVMLNDRGGSRKICPYCGSSSWEESPEDYEEIYLPITRSDGSIIPGATRQMTEIGTDESGLPIMELTEIPTKVPYYKPDIYPILLQKNVSLFGSFLGDSDIDKISTHQNTTNRIEAKIIDKLVKSGSYITLPDDASIKVDEDDLKVIRPGNAANKALIDVFNLQGNISQDMAYLAQIYEEARQIIGITDSFQGRADRTATSGKAKEFAAAQSAGRLESKRIMKNAIYSRLFEAMFKFKLAYADEPRPVVSTDDHGNSKYELFNRYDFLEQDEAGQWCWNDRFLFSCDTAAPLASNREAMWQETRMNLQTGAFGDPSSISTLILFWAKMELLHYPGAGDTKRYLEEELKRQRQSEMQAQMQAQAQMQPQIQAQAPDDMIHAILRQAKADAARDAGGGDVIRSVLARAKADAARDAMQSK